MNTSLSTFMKIGITALTIGILLFGICYAMLDSEADAYKTEIEQQRVSLP